MAYTVNKVAKMTGVTLRTLRYYGSIGLLHPSSRTDVGYRLYDDNDLKILQQILLLREMDFSLNKISEIISAPDYDRKTALETQVVYLEKCAKHYSRLAQLANDTLDAIKGEIDMNNKELFVGFSSGNMEEIQKQFEEEVKQKWGFTNAYQISVQRTARYSKADWDNITNLQKIYIQEIAQCFNEGLPADHKRARDAVEKAREFIDKYFYPCSPDMMGNLGNLYICDPRFKEYYNKTVDGLAEYYNEAIQLYRQNNKAEESCL